MTNLHSSRLCKLLGMKVPTKDPIYKPRLEKRGCQLFCVGARLALGQSICPGGSMHVGTSGKHAENNHHLICITSVQPV